MASTDFTNGSTLTDAEWFDDTDQVTYGVLTSVAGTNTITATGPVSLAYGTKNRLWFIPANTNTGATTINVTPSGGSALGAKNIFNRGVACVGGELMVGVPTLIVGDGTQFNVMNPQVIKGTATNDAAATGLVGEYVESVISTTANFPTSAEWGDLTSISLTAGDWDVSALMTSVASGATMSGEVRMGISTTSGNSITGLTLGSNRATILPPTSLSDNSTSIPPYRMSLSGTTTVYFKYYADYSSGTPKAAGRLSARRVR